MTAAFLGERALDPPSRSQAGILMTRIINIQLFCCASHEKSDLSFRLLSFHSKAGYFLVAFYVILC